MSTRPETRTPRTPPAPGTPAAERMSEVGKAFEKRRALADRLAAQDSYIGEAVRRARAAGVTWADMARAGQVSEVAVLKASRRPEKV
ncbi:RNA polymerase sigma factor [Microbacterium phage Cinna]|uniref:RNA polymerase sigma factor n=3 Tax=Mementomorivirus TaxID=2733194 RepID=A0A6B9LEH7_9CAUD|nr:RNA polymerase sigma factor [Microbacterium phage MementoMori]YP_010750992.1 RNA polymerase sigma factor [Microbacterium phage Matzah]YP_010751087.1 RNA polymerase sigma factor [Microbacterium phage Cinna]AWY05335.1 RNA polymerase sigma factor [Microbacterium phage MementoMori]QDH91664.1 RNA polymerase sigma factor [Microbacterium phage Cinna]QHB37075.1 RNA polymerase sigma factor [Microbacterium phage Matzah]